MNNQTNGTFLKLALVIVVIIGTLLIGLNLLNRNVMLNAQDIAWSYCDDNFYFHTCYCCQQLFRI